LYDELLGRLGRRERERKKETERETERERDRWVHRCDLYAIQNYNTLCMNKKKRE
jgi:hypothetical protein